MRQRIAIAGHGPGQRASNAEAILAKGRRLRSPLNAKRRSTDATINATSYSGRAEQIGAVGAIKHERGVGDRRAG